MTNVDLRNNILTLQNQILYIKTKIVTTFIARNQNFDLRTNRLTLKNQNFDLRTKILT